MAKTHEHDAPIPQYDDGAIETMRIGGYVGVLPYRQFPDLSAADQRALMVGRRYLGERAAQSDLTKWQKTAEGKAASNGQTAAHISAFLAAWEPPIDGDFSTVAARRAEMADKYMMERFADRLDGLSESEKAATLAASRSTFLAHPRHGAEIAKMLANFYATYVQPEKRDKKDSAPVDATKIVILDPDAIA